MSQCNHEVNQAPMCADCWQQCTPRRFAQHRIPHSWGIDPKAAPTPPSGWAAKPILSLIHISEPTRR
eukprot:4425478-Lingulodinium_polyedra.AAC.1